MSQKYLCPVCGFEGLTEPPFDMNNDPSFEVCSCCGFEFGFDGENNPERFMEYRKHWISEGTPWFNAKLKPNDWDYKEQLKNVSTPG
jgi:hypothetical protein